MTVTGDTSHLNTVLVGRQGIYDANRVCVAYELLFRQLSVDTLQTEQDHEAATAQVLGAVFGDFGVAEIAGDRPLFVNFTRAFLVGEIALPDMPERLVVEVLEHVELDAEVLDGLRTLRDLGYRVAADDWNGDPDRDPLLELSDVVKLDLSAVERERLPALAARVRELNPLAQLLIERVEDQADLDLALEVGADLLQGYFLERPQTVSTSAMTPSDLVCLRLLGAIASDAEVKEIERLVSSDPGLALRVLRTASSPGGVGRPIKSVQQAVVLLGPRKLSAWVVLMVVGGATRVPPEQVVTMLTRAGACATLVPGDRDVAYTAGLLSAVAEVLGSDVEDTLRSSGVDEEIADAVLRGEGPVGAALRAVVGHERANPQIVAANGFTPFEVSRAYLFALSEAIQTASVINSG